jgi:hypothetical protein
MYGTEVAGVGKELPGAVALSVNATLSIVAGYSIIRSLLGLYTYFVVRYPGRRGGRGGGRTSKSSRTQEHPHYLPTSYTILPRLISVPNLPRYVVLWQVQR